MYVCMYGACMYVCVRMLEALELESQIAVSCHVGAGNQTRVFQKSSQRSQLLSHLSSP